MSEQLINAIADMDEEGALALTKELLAGGTPPAAILDACRAAMELVGKRFEHGEYFIPELILAGEMLKGVSAEVKPYMTGAQAEAKKGAKVVVGTVKGDIHDIGKDIVVFMLDVNGFEVTDLGIDVPVQTFVDAIAKEQAGGGGAERLPDAGVRLDEGDRGGDRAGRAARRGQDHGRRRHGGRAGVQVRRRRCVRPRCHGRGLAGQGLDGIGEYTMFTKPANWKQLTPEEKKKLRFDAWEQSTEAIPFVSPEAAAGYRERAQRLRQAYDLAHPDRIIADMSMGAGEYALRRKGLNGKDIVYNHEKLLEPTCLVQPRISARHGRRRLPLPRQGHGHAGLADVHLGRPTTAG